MGLNFGRRVKARVLPYWRVWRADDTALLSVTHFLTLREIMTLVLGRNLYFRNHGLKRINIFLFVDLYLLMAYITSSRSKVDKTKQRAGRAAEMRRLTYFAIQIQS